MGDVGPRAATLAGRDRQTWYVLSIGIHSRCTFAVREGHADVVRALLDLGADASVSPLRARAAGDCRTGPWA